LNIHIDDIHPGITFTQVSHSPRYRIHPGIAFTQVSHSPRYLIHPGISLFGYGCCVRCESYVKLNVAILRLLNVLCQI